MKSIKLPFGLRGDKLVHISEVSQGLACNCVCPSCKKPLIARKGNLKIDHFAHQNGDECATAVQTALHLASKQILAEQRRITLPPVNIHFNANRSAVLVSDEQTFELDEVREEHRTEDVIPDILAYVHGIPLMIEIRVTHAVDKTKLSKIRRLGISTIEIDLSSTLRSFSRAHLLNAVIHQTAYKEWLFNAKSEKYRQLFLSTGEWKKIIQRGATIHIDHCPINIRTWRGKPYANLIDDCLSCDFILDAGGNMEGILCGGRHKIKTINDLRTFCNKP